MSKSIPTHNFQPIPKDKKQKPRRFFIFFDIETRQDHRMDGPTERYLHIANMCIAYRLCDSCRNKKLGVCSNCGVNRHVFKGENCMKEFGRWLFSKENRNSLAIAHNARGYDCQFLLDYIHSQRTVKPTIISRGMYTYLLFLVVCH